MFYKVIALLSLLLIFFYSARDIKDDLSCKEYDKNITCCEIDNSGTKCLPYFIIAGTQKSGTTVLSALLSDHPNILFHATKEVHFFNRDQAFSRGIKEYLKGFPFWNKSSSYESENPPLYGESTPFYIASRTSCARISEMIPNVKMIILLREPVSRAYSEYQMKKRRVDIQNNFIQLMQKYSYEMSTCMVKHRGDIADIQRCAPKVISTHKHWNRFKQSQIDHLKRQIYSNKMMVMRTVNRSGKNHSHPGEDMKNICYSLVPETPLELRNISKSAFISSNRNRPDRRILRTFVDGPALFSEVNQPTSLVSNEFLMNKPGSQLYFRPINCLGRHGKETLQSLHDAFYGEILYLKECGGSAFGSSVAQLDATVDRCLKVTKGISQQYVYRSLYLPQFYHCFKFLPRSQFLVLPAERLRKEPAVIRRAVLSFLGLWNALCDEENSSHSNCSQLHDASPENIKLAVAKYFPRFEINTGWRLNSDYPPIPSHTERIMQEFFRPLNKLLFEYLDIDPYPEWSYS